MSYFPIEFVSAFGYLLAASDVRKIFDNQANSNWHLAISQTKTATLCRLGLGLGHPRATQGPPKRRFGVKDLFSTRIKKMPGGVGEIW
jgi:hypothetical protein